MKDAGGSPYSSFIRHLSAFGQQLAWRHVEERRDLAEGGKIDLGERACIAGKTTLRVVPVAARGGHRKLGLALNMREAISLALCYFFYAQSDDHLVRLCICIL